MSTQVRLDCATTPAAAMASGNERKASPIRRKRPHEGLAEASEAEAHRTIRSSKSRSGCGFCKQKRLKCDETKPECKNCLNRDRKCPGYKQVYQWKAKCQTDVRSFDATLRKKIDTPRSTVSRRQPRSKQIHVDEGETEASETVEPQSDRTYGMNVGNDGESHRMSSDDFEALESYQGFVGIDLDGLSVDEMGARSHCVTLPIPELVPDNTFAFPLDYDSMSDYNRPFESAPSYVDRPYITTEIDVADPMRGSTDDEAITTIMSPTTNSKPRDIRSLLSRFYATSPSVPLPLVHHATRLVEHYFSATCGIYSCFDSFLNPFRYTVSESWTRSASTYYAIQSMAAAHLANELPHLRTEGLNFHRKASQHLGQELQMCRSGQSNYDQALLSLLLLGMSACWQRPGDLGLPYLRMARSFMYKTLAGRDMTKTSPTMRQLQQFFEEALVYWEMVTSFVADEVEIDALQPVLQDDDQADQADNLLGGVGDKAPLPGLPPMVHSSELIPHPWTGVSPESQMLLGQVGRLVRRARVRDRVLNDEIHLFGLALQLEESLLEATTPSMSSMTDCGDFVTQTSDFVTLAETTRDAGLLELYRVFPALLERRPGPKDSTVVNTSDNCAPGLTSQRPTRSWLTSLAVNILRRLETIPDSSNVRCHQLLLIVIAAAELRLPSVGKIHQLEISDLDAEVLWGRQFARARLHQLAVQLPAQPVYTIMELISEVWRRVDASNNRQSDDTFWIDVMVEKGWHTIMG